MCPTPDMLDDGSAFDQYDPLQEQFNRPGDDPWSRERGNANASPIGASGRAMLPSPSQERVPPPAQRPISTPWGSMGAQQGPADFATGGTVPTTPQMPSRLGLHLSATADPAAAQLDLAEHSKLKCPKCDAVQSASNKQCANCGHDLTDARKAKFANLSGDDALAALGLGTDAARVAYLNLSFKSADKRRELAAKGHAMADGTFPIENAKDVQNAVTLWQSGHHQTDAAKQHIIKNAKRLGATDKLPDDWSSSNNMGAEHQATVFWNLADDGGTYKDGLLWKVLCKTGTLALSPGPGQIDAEQPLHLTPDLFMSAKQAFDEKAYEHVVIPAKHEDAHDPLANHGTVKALDVLTKQQALDDVRLSQSAKDQIKPDATDTLYMLGGLDFTEPDTKAKAERGSILNCSVGFKFNVRPNKLTGKTYPVAIEHVALTQQPWVYGLPAFGGRDLSGPFNIEDEVPWDGVFLSLPDSPTPPAPTEPENGGESAEGTLSEGDGGGELHDVTPNGDLSQMPDQPAPTTPEEQGALERVLADLTARAEAAEQRAEALTTQLSQTNGALSATAEQLHAEQVAKRVRNLQLAGYSPALLTRVEALLLAEKPQIGDGENGLSLSATLPGQDGTMETQDFQSVSEVVDFLLAATPTDPEFDPSSIQQGVHLAQEQQKDGKTDTQKADEFEQRIHPERFDADGKRIAASERAKKR